MSLSRQGLDKGFGLVGNTNNTGHFQPGEIYIKRNVWGSWGIKGDLDWVKTRCLVILIYFKTLKTPENYKVCRLGQKSF